MKPAEEQLGALGHDGALAGVKMQMSEESDQQRGKLEPSSWAKSLHTHNE